MSFRKDSDVRRGVPSPPARPTPARPQHAPARPRQAAPAVYRPQPTPKVLQRKTPPCAPPPRTAAPSPAFVARDRTPPRPSAAASQPHPHARVRPTQTARPASVQLKPAAAAPHRPAGGAVIQMDPKYVVPQDYNKVRPLKSESYYQYGASQLLPDTQTTYATAKINGWYLNKVQSSGEHAEEFVIAQVKHLCDTGSKALLPIGQKNKLSIHLNKSPCTSVSRDSLPQTRTDNVGCTERLIHLATHGYNGHTFYIRLKIQNLYQPQIKGAKNASIRAIKELEANGISVIGYNREYKLERAQRGEKSTRNEPLSPNRIANDDDDPFTYSKEQKKKLKKQWESVSKAVNKPNVYRWRDNV